MAAAFPETTPHHTLDVIFSYLKSQVLFGACECGIFIAIEELGQSSSAIELAQKLDLTEEGATRLLNGCVALQLLKKVPGTDGGDMFQNTQESREWLGMDTPWNISKVVKFEQNREYSLITPGKAAKKGYPRTKVEDIYNAFTRENVLQFHDGMEGFARSSFSLLPKLPLEKYRNCVDLGGGLSGFHARNMKKLHPDMNVTLAELPSVIQEARETGTYEGTDIQLTSIDFLKDPLPAGDLYILGNIIHDWAEDTVDFIIKSVYDALLPGGALLLLELTLNSSKTAPWLAVAMDLTMHSFTNGKQRTEDEFRALLKRHGFAEIHLYKDQKSPLHDAILATKTS